MDSVGSHLCSATELHCECLNLLLNLLMLACIYVLQNFQFDEQKDQVTVERILRVVYVDPERPSAVSKSMNTGLFLSVLCIGESCVCEREIEV